MTKARDIADFKFENITDTGTEGTKVALGTTAQRGSTTGQWRYNTTTGFFEGRNSSGVFSTLEPTPIISSVDDGEIDSAGGGNQTIVVTGTNFSSGGTISFVGTSAEFNASTTTFNSTTQVTAVAPKASFLNAQEPYKVKFTSSGGVAGISADGLINVDNSPVWQTASGNVATIFDNATGTHATVSATDADGDTVAYSLQSGSIPAGTSLNTSSGAISGNPTDVGSATTSNFTLRATANTKTTDRAFNMIVNQSAFNLRYLVIAGGGGGGTNGGNYENGGGGGAGGYLTNASFGVTHATNYTVTVGGGGNAEYNGSNSVFSTITSIGGGGGNGNTNNPGENGGSGGGGTSWAASAGGSGTSGQGNNGGAGSSGTAETGGSGGGGGAGGTGGNGSGNTGGNGGAGLASDITGSSITRAGGGGGWGLGGSLGQAGSGGAGAGNGSAGTANTGSGGGGQRNGTGGTGGSGIVILRYPNTKTLTIGAGLTHSTATVGSDKVTSFTAGTGTINF